MWCGALRGCGVVKLDSCNNFLSSIHTILVNILWYVRLYIKQKYYYYYYTVNTCELFQNIIITIILLTPVNCFHCCCHFIRDTLHYNQHSLGSIISSNTSSTSLFTIGGRRNQVVAGQPLPWDAECYHAGLTAAQRKKIQTDFMSGYLRVVVATVAFGMGLDKSDIRGIIHYNISKTVESYIQEIGRAGRDGKVAYCHLFLDSQVLTCL